MKLQLNEYEKIIFDMDGVVTSEIAYWYAAALAAYDLLTDYEHYGVGGIDREWLRKNYIEVYNTVMCGGRTVKAVKRLGVNTNWDLCLIVFCVSKYINSELARLDAEHFRAVCMFIENIDMKAPEVYDVLSELAEHYETKYECGHFKRSSDFFESELVTCFDLWYNGCEEFEGVKTEEKLLFSDEELKSLFDGLKSRGIRLGIGTGRPKDEIVFPLEEHGLYDYFDEDMIVTYDDVVAAEKELNPGYSLAKPDPFMFLKAALGSKHSDRDLIDGEYTYEELEKTLVVGDAPSDLYSAQRGGFKFLAVLTGAEGENMRQWFVDNKADYIESEVTDILTEHK